VSVKFGAGYRVDGMTGPPWNLTIVTAGSPPKQPNYATSAAS
jgi:hypothetical protein